MKKFIIFVVCCFISSMTVSALENDSHVEYQYIDNIYSNRQVGDGFYTGRQGIVYVNGTVAYCIDPTLILKSETYTSSQEFSSYNIAQETLDYLELVSYFGYGYSDRIDSNYYLATQEIIWEYISGGEMYWTNGKGGELINIDSYKNDIFTSIEHYLLKPDIPNYIETYRGEDVILEDKNEVLQYYESSLWVGEVIDNKLLLDAQFKGTVTINLIKEPLNHKTSYIYLSEGSQTLATFGYSGNLSDKVSIKFKVKTLSQITLIKKDSSNDKVIRNRETKIKIYDVIRDKYIIENGSDILTIGETGSLETETFLEEGEYRIEEVTAPMGYKKVSKTVTFNIHIYDGPMKEIIIYNDPLLYNINIYKQGERYIGLESGIGRYTIENMNDVTYGLFALEEILDVDGNALYLKDSLVSEINIYNGKGMIDNIPYGKYYVREIKCPNEYILDSTITNLTLSEENTSVSLYFTNYMKKGNIMIQKVDGETGLADAEFNLYGNKYLKNIIIKSDDMGYIMIEDLPYDTYHLKEITAPEGYKLDVEEKILILQEENLKYKFPNEKEFIEQPEVQEEEPTAPEESPKEEPEPSEKEPTAPEESPKEEPTAPEESPKEEPEPSGKEPTVPEESPKEEPEPSGKEPTVPEESPKEEPEPSEKEPTALEESPKEEPTENIVQMEKNDYIEEFVENPDTFTKYNNKFFGGILWIFFLFVVNKYKTRA